MENLEAFLRRQKEIIATIQVVHRNFNKDSSSRKTESYIVQRVSTLDSLWTEFDVNNGQILSLAIDKSGEYFTKNIYNETKTLYEKIRKVLTSYCTGFSTDTTKEELDELMNEQRTNFRAFKRLINSIKTDEVTEKWELEDDLKSLQTRWNNIDNLHLKIDNLLKGEDQSYEEEYAQYENQFRAIKKTLNTKISSTVHQYASTPKMEVPAFYGDYTQWPTFLDLYKSSIHDNPALTDAQKMQHLKGKLKGEALRLVQHLNVTADNYKTAWELLYHRYNNDQILFTTQIEIFLNQPTVQKQSSSELKKLHDTTMECIHAIHNLGIDTTTWDPIIVHLLVKKLDPITRSDYKEARKSPRDLPTFDEFIAFLEAKFTALEPMCKKEREDSSLNKQSSSLKKPTFGIGNRGSYYKSPSYAIHANCVLCNSNNHALYQCRKFESMTPEARLRTISQNKLCRNCLYYHERNICKSTKRCKVCKAEHNTLLHGAGSNPHTNNSASTSNYQRQHNANNVTCNDDEILLTTALIRVQAVDKTYLTLRALLDQGSQITLITENAAQRLGLPRQFLNASITGIGESSKRSKGKIHLNCKSIHDDYEFTTDALVMPKLLNHLPHNSFDKKKYPHIQHIQLADPDYNISQQIDILLNAKIYSDIIMGGLIKGSEKQPIAQQTKLGWILSGQVTTFHCNVVINNLDDISNYWEMEEISTEKTTLTQEEQFCETLYIETTNRLPDGRYEVRLPMKENFEEKLGHSKARAIAQFKQLESRLLTNDKLQNSYRQFMAEYEELGHMKECSTQKQPMCYLPHHGVHREDSTTTKLRVVFNASSKTSSGNTLNDLMECGPKLQQDIQDLLLRWRTYQYVYTADCEKMYRCILLHEDQQHLQKIIWRDQPHDLLKEYQLCTITYGMKAAPFLAMRTMQLLAKNDADKYPLAAKVLENDFYVDDLLSGTNSLTQAREIQKQLIDMLRGAGINLRKWSSNHVELLSELSPEQINPSILDFKNSNSTKALGIRWNPITDMFTFHNIDNDNKKKCTKRILLSNISKIFDPLGWLSPLTIRAKLLFQQVWLLTLGWDDEIPHEIQQEWNRIQKDLQNIDKFDIPRWIGNVEASLELHGFCDASERAYACVIYLKSTNIKNDTTVRIIAAKTKLAPRKKTVTLPRLELCGALLLATLMKKVTKTISTENIPVYGWTDSLVVLGWLQGNLSRWKTFVANRAKEILDVMPVTCWRHVTSQDNAADCATRGVTTSQLTQHSLWWEGPSWIKTDIPKPTLQIDAPQIEIKNEPRVCVAQISFPLIEELINKHSSISHIVRVIGYISRFITNVRHRVTKRMQLAAASREHDTLGIIHNAPNSMTYLTSTEIEQAYRVLVKAVQMQEFQNDINQIRQNGSVKSSSNLLKLNPYLDENNILRVGGRLHRSQLTENAKHPCILPKDSRLTKLIIEKTHLHTLHGGPSLTLALLRQKYWILGGIRTVKKHLRTCVKCFRFSRHNHNQIMADLPKARVTPSRPFTHTGVDFTGQVELKANKGRGIKTTRGYIAVFVCFATKAIHLELVSDLSTPAFLAAFKRMCARRGTPKHLYSDNGTNFTGAARILKKEHTDILQTINEEFLNEISDMGTTWHFNAPSWPSAGGLWEAAVKSTKHHLKRVLGEQKLTFEEFTTLLTQIEACLNSRPLFALTENPDDEYLTPGHFLVGGPLLAPPLTDFDTRCITTRWQLTEKMHRDFWKKWSSDYLHHLQMRSKWNHPKKDLKINDIVIIKDDNMPPTKWALGRVKQVHPGKDGHVRVVTLKTKSGESKRPITKLAPLPIREPDTKNPTATPDIHDNKPDTPSTPRATRNLRRNRRKPNMVLSILFMLLTFMTSGIYGMWNINGLNKNNTLYFDKVSDIRIIQDEWKMVIFYNMSTYWQSMTSIENYIQFVKKSCKNDITCAPIITQFEHEINELNHYNELLTNAHNIMKQRRKRGLINGIGNVANALFGVLDNNFAKKYEHDIEMIHKRENHIMNLFKNQTSVLEAENNILKRNELIMNKQFETIGKNMKLLSTAINEVQTVNHNALNAFYILSSIISADVIISHLRRIQEALLDTVTDIYHGRLNIHLLPPEQIQQQINLISSHLQDDLVMPADTVRELYGLLHIQAKVTNKYLIMEVKIPLVNRDLFELDEIIDIPQMTDNRTIYTTTQTKYLAINVKKDTVLPMTETDIHSCIQHTNQQMLCQMNHPIYTLQIGESICDMRLMISDENKPFCRATAKECTDRWLKLHTRDTWLFSCCDKCSVRIMCANKVKTKHLEGNGFVTLDQGCVIKGESLIIYAQHNYVNKIFTQPDIEIDTPSVSLLNYVINTSLPKEMVIESHNDTFNAIQQNIDVLKRQELEQWTPADSKNYIAIYVILCIITVILLPFTFCNLRRWWQNKKNNSREYPIPTKRIEEIELSDIRTTAPPPPPVLPAPRMSSAMRGSVMSVDSATSPIPQRKISFNLGHIQ